MFELSGQRRICPKLISSRSKTKAETTKRDYNRALRRIEEEFGTTPTKAVGAPRTRGLFKAWRDSMDDRPGTADRSWTVLTMVISVCKDRGVIPVNPCERGGRLYESDRADKIWTEDDLARLFDVCSPGSLMPSSWRSGRGSGSETSCASRRPASKATTYACAKVRRANASRFRLDLRCDLPLTIPRTSSTQILNSSHGTPWTSDGFRTSFGRACA